ncbi:MAG: DNA-3-methyladenine glycosylase [Chitinophagales bacterium]|nr:DNA-3-methyladenine glycosylase [Chitinophagales bacterium]
MDTLTIDTPHEFSYQQALHFLKRSPQEVLHFIQHERIEKVIYIDEKPVLMAVTANGKQLQVSVLNQRISAAMKEVLIQYMEDWFDLKTDLQPFYAMAMKDRLLRTLVIKYAGYRIIGIPDLFESLCWAIIGQQINLSFAYKLKRSFVMAFGRKFSRKGNTYFHFPLPEAIASLDPDDLLQLQFSRQKAQYVINVAEAFVAGTIAKNRLSILSFQAAKEALMSLKGIGNWTANYALMKTFHFPNAFPLQDAGLHQAIAKQLNLQKKPTLLQIEEQFKKYMGWEAYATLYLWRSLSDD